MRDREPRNHVGAETPLPRTFTFLGFLRYGAGRKGRATVWQHTAEDRVGRTSWARAPSPAIDHRVPVVVAPDHVAHGNVHVELVHHVVLVADHDAEIGAVAGPGALVGAG